jgi:hypothetical protein
LYKIYLGYVSVSKTDFSVIDERIQNPAPFIANPNNLDFITFFLVFFNSFSAKYTLCKFDVPITTLTFVFITSSSAFIISGEFLIDFIVENTQLLINKALPNLSDHFVTSSAVCQESLPKLPKSSDLCALILPSGFWYILFS